MSTLALILWSIYVAVALVLRVMLQWRAVRRTGWVVAKNAPGSKAWALAMFVTGASLICLASPALAVLWPGAALWRVWWLPAQVGFGVSVYTLGLVVTFVAQLQMGDAWRIGVDPTERTRLIVHGLFRGVRNPIYAGMLLSAGGLAWLAPTWLSLIGFGTLLAALELQVRLLEEPYLLRTHGAEYRAYAARAGRFVPGIGRLEPTG